MYIIYIKNRIFSTSRFIIKSCKRLSIDTKILLKLCKVLCILKKSVSLIKSIDWFSVVLRLVREYFTNIHWTCRGVTIAGEVLLDSSMLILGFYSFKQGCVFTVRYGASIYRVSSEESPHLVASYKKSGVLKTCSYQDQHLIKQL